MLARESRQPFIETPNEIHVIITVHISRRKKHNTSKRYNMFRNDFLLLLAL